MWLKSHLKIFRTHSWIGFNHMYININIFIHTHTHPHTPTPTHTHPPTPTHTYIYTYIYIFNAQALHIHAVLTHWGRTTHTCVGKLTTIGSDNGLSPGRRQAIIWTIAGILLIGTLGTNFSEILIEIRIFSFKKMGLNVSSAKWRPFCLSLNVLNVQTFTWWDWWWRPRGMTEIVRIYYHYFECSPKIADCCYPMWYVYFLLLDPDSPVGLWAGIPSAGEWVPETPSFESWSQQRTSTIIDARHQSW